MGADAVLARPPVALVVSEHEWSTLSLESVLGPSGYAVLRAFNGRRLVKVRRVGDDSLAVLGGYVRGTAIVVVAAIVVGACSQQPERTW